MKRLLTTCAWALLALALFMLVGCSGGGGTDVTIDNPDNDNVALSAPAFRGLPRVKHKSGTSYIDGKTINLGDGDEFSDAVEVEMEVLTGFAAGTTPNYGWRPITNATVEIPTSQGTVSVPVVRNVAVTLGDRPLALTGSTNLTSFRADDYPNGDYRRNSTVDVDEDALTAWVASEVLGIDLSEADTIISVSVEDGDDSDTGFIEGVVTGGAIVMALLTFCPEGTSGYDVSIDHAIQPPPPPPANLPPVAKLTVSPTSGTAPLLVSLDASSSTDSDGTIVKYEWDFDGNGTFDSDGTGAIASHPYAVGTYTPRVRVTDNDGATDIATASASITVTAPPANQPPVAGISAIPSSGVAPLTVEFDGSASTGSPTSYQWNFDDGGAIATGVSTSHVYSTAGEYHPTLTVTNAEGSDSATTTITVTTGGGNPDNNLYPVDADVTGHLVDGKVVLEVITPVGDGVGYILWEIAGPSNASTVPQGSHPQTTCWMLFEQTGGYTVTATPYASEDAYQTGKDPVGDSAIFYITITAG